jgi:hypothetical protein
MKKALIFSAIITVFFFEFIIAQDDIQIGSQSTDRTTTGALYDYSNPNAVNIKVQLWGYVKFPGYYIVPAGTSLNELMSLGGGPIEDATLNDIRVVKIREGSQTTMVKYDYNDLVWEENIDTQINYVKLDAGDVVVVPGKPRYFVREDITFYTSLLTSIASITALVVSIIVLTNQ